MNPPIRSNDPENMPGIWKVETYIDGQYVLTQKFIVAPHLRKRHARVKSIKAKQLMKNILAIGAHECRIVLGL